MRYRGSFLKKNCDHFLGSLAVVVMNIILAKQGSHFGFKFNFNYRLQSTFPIICGHILNLLKWICFLCIYIYIWKKRCKGFLKSLMFLKGRLADLILANFCTFHFHNTEFTFLLQRSKTRKETR